MDNNNNEPNINRRNKDVCIVFPNTTLNCCNLLRGHCTDGSLKIF